MDDISNKLFLRLSSATFNYGLGQILPMIIGFFLIPVYTRYLTPEDYGIVALAGPLSALIVILMRVGVPGAVTRFYYDYKEGSELRNYITTVSKFLNI